MPRLLIAPALGAFVALLLLAAPAPTYACGGCFAPTGQPSVVTAHRMAVSISADESTLWDQFEYAGAPEDFVWVLPVAGDQDVTVELADDAFFAALATASQVTLQAPFPPFSGGGFGCGASAGDSAPMSGEPVTVFRREVVGPYETVTVGSADAGSLVGWLTDNGYAVPDTLLPIIDHYIVRRMNFVVLRLAPGAGVQQMQPVRVTTPGMHVTFPLRMVSAGVADSVALELFVIGEGRWAPANFVDAEVDVDDIVYDWDTAEFNYDALAAEQLARSGGRAWLTESAEPANTYLFSRDYYDADGNPGSPADDWAHATRSLGPEPWITRMRAELPVAALDVDLVLVASMQGPRPGFIRVTNEVNRPSAAPSPLLRIGGGTGEGVPPAPLGLALLAAAGTAFIVRRRIAAARG